LVTFALKRLKLSRVEVMEIYLSGQTRQVKQMIRRLQPLKLKRAHPLAVAGLKAKSTTQAQLQEQQAFKSDCLKQID
jgi:hypothetical protein